MREYEDTYRHKGLRKKLIDSLRNKGIKDESVLEAMMSIPRHFFMDSALDNISYEDRAFPIAENQTISQPYTVAYQTELLAVNKNEKILEIGTGSMYQATVLAAMNAKVFTIERQKVLFEKTKNYIFKTKYPNLKFFYGDGYLGLQKFSPFDKILITAAAPHIPPKLIEQLSIGGIMVVPVDEGKQQRMLRVTKIDTTNINVETFLEFSFVPMLEGKNSAHKNYSSKL